MSERIDQLAEMLRKQAPNRVTVLFDEVLMPTPRKRKPPELIGETLREVIRKRGLTAYRLSQASGVSIDSIQRWLNGKHGLTLATVEKLAAALDLVLTPREQE
jgi:DNA-binding phage protein